MSRIKGKDTKPEMLIRRWLWSNGYRYRLHADNLPGKPDIVFSGRKKAIFVNGCFSHKHDCKYFKWPATNTGFWEEKITENVARDIRNYDMQAQLGWIHYVIWECEVKNDEECIQKRLADFIDNHSCIT